MATPTPSEVQAAQKYLVTNGVKISPSKFAASHKELGSKSFDDTLATLRSLARGASDQEQELKERVDQAVKTETGKVTRIEYLKKWRTQLGAELTAIAHRALRTALPFDSYNVERGKYRAIADLVGKIDVEVKKLDGDDDAISEPEPTPGEDEDFETPRPTARRRVQPRSWG